MPPSVAVAVVCICSAEHLARCLAALRAQENAPPFRIVVCHDPQITGIAALATRHPEALISANAGQRTPPELAAAALRMCNADVVLLTEDHCVPRPDWVRRMLAARAPGRAAVGGRVEIRAPASAVEWAFYFVDFFRYAAPVREGPSPSLTVCNVAYDGEKLDAIRDLWRERFQEPAVNEALRARFGVLWLEPNSEMAMQRSVSLRDALYERYAFGRLFACTRIEHLSSSHRWLYAVLAPALPALLLARMAAKAVRSSVLARAFLGALFPVVAMVASWSWGEWLGYLTARHPRSLVVARELRATNRSGEGRA
jgi:Glycosyltransferase like family 2